VGDRPLSGIILIAPPGGAPMILGGDGGKTTLF
jgi:hypothetical protein